MKFNFKGIILIVAAVVISFSLVTTFLSPGVLMNVPSALSYLAGEGYTVYADPAGTVNATTVNATTLNAPTGRTATFVIAASDATATEKAQADVVCTGVSTLTASLSGAHLVSPAIIAAGTTTATQVTVSAGGNVTVTLGAGQTGLATSGTWYVTGGPQVLSAGVNTVAVNPLTLTGIVLTSTVIAGSPVTIGAVTTYTATITGAGTITVRMPQLITATLTDAGHILTAPPSILQWSQTYTLTATASGTIVFAIPATGTFYISGMGDESVINSALSTYGKIYLTSGIFNCFNRILIPSNSWLDGKGTLYLVNNVNDRFIVNYNRIPNAAQLTYAAMTIDTNIKIINLTIDGNKNNQASLGAVDRMGNAGCLDFRGVNGLTVQNTTINNGFGAGTETEFTTNFLIDGNLVDNSLDDDIAPNEGSWQGVVSNNICLNAGLGLNYGAPNGIEVQDNCHDITITGNTIVNPHQDGIQVDIHSPITPAVSPCYNLTFTGNTINGAGVFGFECNGVPATGVNHDITFSANSIINCVSNGIYVYSTTNFNISSNTIKSCIYGIYITASPKGIITANQVTSCTSTGIYISTLSDYTQVENNTCSLNGLMGINIYGSTYIIVTGNYCIDNGTASGSSQIGIGVRGTYCTISNNVCIEDGGGHQQYGIYVYTDPGYNQIKNNSLTGNTIHQLDGVSGLTNNTISGNIGYIATGEIRTISGTITPVTQDAITSVENLFGQDVRILGVDIEYTTKSSVALSTIQAGLNTTAADSTGLFALVPCDSTAPQFFRSTIPTLGTQTLPLLWKSGSGNKYVNFSIKTAAATGMVATYTITVMGN